MPLVGPERSDSTYTMLRSERKTRDARLRIAVPACGEAGSANPIGRLPLSLNSIRRERGTAAR